MADAPRMEALDHHLTRTPWAELARALSSATLVARGQYSPTPATSVRVGVLSGTTLAWSGWMAPEDLAPLAKALGARLGQWDAMYATGWSLAWTTDEGPLRIWSDGGELSLPPPPHTKVRAYVKNGWVTRGVAIDDFVVKEVEDHISLVDPTYDALNLFCETSWARSLARALGAALQVPVEIDEDLT